MDPQVLTWVATFSYPAVLALLAGTGLGLPISEELVILSAGLVAAKGGANLYLMALTCVLGVLLSDSILFGIGSKLGPKAVEHRRLRRLLTTRRVAWLQRHFAHRGGATIFLARFLPGLRAPTFLVAGMGGMSRRKFLLADLCAASISAPLLLFLGNRYGPAVLEQVRGAGKLGAIVALAGVLGIALVRTLLRGKRTGNLDRADG